MGELKPEINALLQLLDDTDTAVATEVESRILSYGERILPELENFGKGNFDPFVQTRLEEIIAKIQLVSIEKDLKLWSANPENLLQGLLSFCRLYYPDLERERYHKKIETVRRAVWLELNSYLTPLEQSKIMHRVMYQHFQYGSVAKGPQLPHAFLLPSLIDQQKANGWALTSLYLVLAEWLDLPVRGIKMLDQILLAWFQPQLFTQPEAFQERPENFIIFYTDPNTGLGFGQGEIDRYLKTMNQVHKPQYFTPLTNQQFLATLIKELAKVENKNHNELKFTSLEKLFHIFF